MPSTGPGVDVSREGMLSCALPGLSRSSRLGLQDASGPCCLPGLGDMDRVAAGVRALSCRELSPHRSVARASHRPSSGSERELTQMALLDQLDRFVDVIGHPQQLDVIRFDKALILEAVPDPGHEP